MTEAVLEVQDLSVSYPVHRRLLRALREVTLTLQPGQTLGVVGESGSGKTTLGRALLRLVPICGGSVYWRKQEIHALGARALRALRAELQIVFQDPLASLDPRMPVATIVAEPLSVFRPDLDAAARLNEVARTMARVGLGAGLMDRYPHELSGGQCQRVAIARATIIAPRLLVCDEPLSALDVSVKAQIVNLLAELRAALGMSLIFISHNLAVVRRLCDRVMVLYLGRSLEEAGREQLFAAPLHPYTRILLASVPPLEPRRARARNAPPIGEPASPLAPPSGCVFHPRCPWAIERCRREVPRLEDAVAGRRIACHRWRELPTTPG